MLIKKLLILIVIIVAIIGQLITVATVAIAATKSSSASAVSKKVLIGTFYINKIFANLHQHPSPYSPSVQIVACGDPVKVYESNDSLLPPEWTSASTSIYGEANGFLSKNIFSKEKESCLQNKYPKFFNLLNLELTEMYHWGKLYDQYITVKTRVR